MELMQRLFILSDSPPEKDVQWSERVLNHHLNLSKPWNLNSKILEEWKKITKTILMIK